MLARWRQGQKALQARLRAGGQLTAAEEQWLDFVTQKIDDWESDWNVQP